jgi:hypothetical protein
MDQAKKRTSNSQAFLDFCTRKGELIRFEEKNLRAFANKNNEKRKRNYQVLMVFLDFCT